MDKWKNICTNRHLNIRTGIYVTALLNTRDTYWTSCCSSTTVVRSLKAFCALFVAGDTTSSSVWQTENTDDQRQNRFAVIKWQRQSSDEVSPHSGEHCSLPVFFELCFHHSQSATPLVSHEPLAPPAGQQHCLHLQQCRLETSVYL